MIHLHIGTDSLKNRRARVCLLKVDVCYSDTFLSAPTFRRTQQHTNRMRELAIPNHARSHLPELIYISFTIKVKDSCAHQGVI